MSPRTRQTQVTKAGTLETSPVPKDKPKVTFDEVTAFERSIELAKFHSDNDDTDGLPMIEAKADLIAHIFKNTVNLTETPYVIYKDVKVYVEGSYEGVKAKEKVKPGFVQGTLPSIPLDSTPIKIDGLSETFEGEGF